MLPASADMESGWARRDTLTTDEVGEIKSWNEAGLFTGQRKSQSGPCKASNGCFRIRATVQTVCAGLWTGLGHSGAQIFPV